MFKKILILGAAIAALVAIAAPAAQAKHFFKLNGVNIAKEETVAFSGATNFELTSKAAGFHLNAIMTIKLKNGTIPVGGNAGTVTEVHVSNCTGTGQLNGLPCTPTGVGDNPTVQNWPVTLNADTSLTIGVNLLLHYYPNPHHTGAPVATTTLAGPVIVDLSTPASIKTATLTPGAGLLANGQPATIGGTLNLATAGTWSLGV